MILVSRNRGLPVFVAASVGAKKILIQIYQGDDVYEWILYKMLKRVDS